ncbi:MAG: hypothetical protein KDC03_21550, partial [Flavobacteriales bacterium]|nr:hypothetical protein [Flavobacteriales bacterium]
MFRALTFLPALLLAAGVAAQVSFAYSYGPDHLIRNAQVLPGGELLLNMEEADDHWLTIARLDANGNVSWA